MTAAAKKAAEAELKKKQTAYEKAHQKYLDAASAALRALRERDHAAAHPDLFDDEPPTLGHTPPVLQGFVDVGHVTHEGLEGEPALAVAEEPKAEVPKPRRGRKPKAPVEEPATAEDDSVDGDAAAVDDEGPADEVDLFGQQAPAAPPAGLTPPF